MNSRPNKKNRSTSNRGGRGKVAERQMPADGVYANHRFMQSVGTLVGLPVEVVTKTKEKFEGVFSTFSPNFEIVLDLPHMVSPGGESSMVTSIESMKKKMIFSFQDIVILRVVNVDMEFATTKETFAIDSAISKYNGQIQAEKELEPWHGEENVYTDLGLGDENANGWDADDMFKKNEEKYGVTTTYSPEMEGYTTPLQKKNTKEWKEQEAKAQQIAHEIEHSPVTQTRAEIENGEDEEEKFSSVVRPDQSSNMGPASGKYMPPQRRKIQDGRSNKQLPRGTPSPQSSGPTIPIISGGRYSNSHSNISSTAYNNNNSGSSNSSSSNNSTNNNNLNNNNSLPSSSIPNSASSAVPPSLGTSYNQQMSSQLKHHNKHPNSNINNNSNNSAACAHTQQTPLCTTTTTTSTTTTITGVTNQKQTIMQQQQLPHQVEAKLNGEPKDTRRMDNFSSYGREQPTHKETYHSEHSIHHNNHPHHHNTHSYSHQTCQQSYHPSDNRRSEPREQREPRKPRNQKEEQQLADLKKFGQDFKLSDPSIDKKATGQQQPQPTQQFTAPNSIPLTKPPQNAHILPPQATTPSQPTSNLHLHQAPTSLPTQRQSPATEPQTASSNNSNITITGVPQQPQPQQPPPTSSQQQQQESTPQSQPSQSNSQVNPETSSHHDSKGSEDENSVVNSNLNPNAKEFVFNPNAKPFNPRSPSTTTPPRVQTPQIAPQPPPPPTQSQIGSVPPSVGFQQNMLHYVMAQPFPVQSQPRFPKRGPGSNQRTDYASSMQVAAATGHPILAPTPLTSITTPQTIPAAAVPIPQNIMPQTHQPYQYQGMSMMLRLPPPGIPMVTTMVPTSMGVYYHGAEGHQNSQGHTPPHMYVTPGVPPHQGHQPHPAPTPGPHPGQPPTPQGHSSGGGPAPPNMPAQPPTPGPTPPQAMMYSGPGSGPMGGQPTIPQHLPQHSPHTGQSPHNPYQNPNAALAAAAAAAASQHHPTATQLVMIPPHLAPHMMPPGGAPPPPPHSGSGHAPSSAAGYTATSSASMQQHVNHGHHVHYIPGMHTKYDW